MTPPSAIYVNNPPLPFAKHTTAIALNHWTVVNAPRPVPGEITWQGDFRHGIFYAAGPREKYGSAWADLDAWPVVPITNLQVVERIGAMATERGTTLAEILDSYDGDMAALAVACDLPWHNS